MTQKSASFIIIGNEILSGRTADKNLNFLANSLAELGIDLCEARVVKDDEKKIIDTVNELRKEYDYVFTSGGIGPTHDDITALSVAKAFNVKLELNTKAKALLEAHYPEGQLNEARMKMAYIPEDSILLNNPVSSAPGFKKENVFVFAGVPKIMQAMFAASKEFLVKGDLTIVKNINCYAKEGDVAGKLAEVQSKYNTIEIGSYPFIKGDKLGTSLVFRGGDKERLESSYIEMKQYLDGLNIEIFD